MNAFTRALRNTKLATQLLFWFLVIEFPAEVTLTYLSYRNAEIALRQTTDNSLNAIAARQSNQIARYLKDKIRNAEVISKTHNVIKSFQDLDVAFNAGGKTGAAYPSAVAAAVDVLAYSQESFQYKDLFLVNQAGVVIYSVKDTSLIGAHLSEEKFKNTEFAKVYSRATTILQSEISDFAYLPGASQPTAFIATPVKSEGIALGALVVQIDNGEVSAVVNDYIGLGETGETVIAAKIDGNALFTTDVRNEKNAAFTLKIPIGSNKDVPLEQAVQGKNGSGEALDYRGKDVLAVWKYIPSLRSGLVVKIDKAEALRPIDELKKVLFSIVALTLGVVMFAAFSVARAISRPILRLTKVAKEIDSGNLNTRIEMNQNDEIGQLSRTFNQMTDKLIRSNRELEESNRTLEEKVEIRTRELNHTLEEVNAQKQIADAEKARAQEAFAQLQLAQGQIVQSEKMAALGQLIAGVAHEINTPLGAIRASNANLQNNLPIIVEEAPSFFKKLNDDDAPLFFQLIEQGLKGDTTSLSSREERKHRKTLEELLASAGVGAEDTIFLARELLRAGMYENMETFLPLFKSTFGAKIIEMASLLGKSQANTLNIDLAVAKMMKIVYALKSYAHTQHTDEAVLTNVKDNIEVVLTIYHNQIKHGIQVVKNYAPNIPMINGYPDELNQVWTNLLHNSLQAMEYKGAIQFDIFPEDSFLVVKITDHGPGIPPEILPRIFDAFFTTKAQGEGSGLGLHICKKIIDKHGGTIAVDTEPGRTTFIIKLPVSGNTAPQEKFIDVAETVGV